MTPLGPGYRSGRVLAAGVRTHYVQAGDRGPAVVLIHGRGLGASGETEWYRLLPLLAQSGYRAFAPDQLSMGFTDTRPHAWPVLGHQSMVDHMAAFIDALCFDEVLLVGNSMGAYVAAKLALDHPDRVGALSLIASRTLAAAMALEAPPGAVAFEPEAWTRSGLQQALLAQYNDSASVTAALLDARLAASARDGVAPAMAAFAQYQQRLQHEPRLLERFLLDHTLPRLRVPAQMLWGEQDKVAPAALGRRLQARLPNFSFHFLPDAGHLCQIEQPAQVAARIVPFFDGSLTR